MTALSASAVADFEGLAAMLGAPARENGPTDRHYWCPCCHSTNNLHLWVDGMGLGAHCFGCQSGIPEVRDALDAGAARPITVTVRGSKPKGRVVGREEFEVRDAAGSLAAVHTRLDLEDGGKVVYWPKGTDPASLPLYGSEDVADFDPSEPVIVTEGERKRDRLKAAGYQSVALVGGSSVAPSNDALSVLKGLRVILWADNDAPGRKVMDRIAVSLAGMASSVARVRWPDAPPAGDAADFLDAHTVEECDALLKAAVPVPTDGPGWARGTSLDVLDLLTSDYPEVVFVVPGIVPEGTAILASNPKVGKSAMVYQLSAELALGGTFLGVDLPPRPVLYLALEDGERRSQQRAMSALRNRRPARGMFSFRWAAPALGDGLEGEVEAWLDEHPSGVVFIDTFQKVRAPQRGNANAYGVDVAEFALLQNIVRRRPGSSVVLVLHLRKASDKDFLARVSGTLGITGSADTTMVIERDRHTEAATLHVTGRDVGEQAIPVRFDGMRWSTDSNRVPNASPERQQVFDIISEMGPIWPSAIAAEINSRGGEQTRGAVNGLVTKLKEDGWITWTAAGYEPAGVKVNGERVRPAATRDSGDSGDSGDFGDSVVSVTQVTPYAEPVTPGDSSGAPGRPGRREGPRERAPENVEEAESPESPQSLQSRESPRSPQSREPRESSSYLTDGASSPILGGRA